MAEQRFADPDTGAADDGGDFLTNDELLGRYLIIIPKALETIKGEGTWPDGREKRDYDRVTGDVIVLDGRKISKIPSYPHLERDKFISARSVVNELRKYVAAQTPVLGYFAMVNKAYFLEPVSNDPEIEAKANAALDRYEAAQGNGKGQSQAHRSE